MASRTSCSLVRVAFFQTRQDVCAVGGRSHGGGEGEPDTAGAGGGRRGSRWVWRRQCAGAVSRWGLGWTGRGGRRGFCGPAWQEAGV